MTNRPDVNEMFEVHETVIVTPAAINALRSDVNSLGRSRLEIQSDIGNLKTRANAQETTFGKTMNEMRASLTRTQQSISQLQSRVDSRLNRLEKEMLTGTQPMSTGETWLIGTIIVAVLASFALNVIWLGGVIGA